MDNSPPPRCLQHIFLTVLSFLPSSASLFSIILNNLPSINTNSFKSPKTTALWSLRHKSSKKSQLRAGAQNINNIRKYQTVCSLNEQKTKTNNKKTQQPTSQYCSYFTEECKLLYKGQVYGRNEKQVQDLLTGRRSAIHEKGQLQHWTPWAHPRASSSPRSQSQWVQFTLSTTTVNSVQFQVIFIQIPISTAAIGTGKMTPTAEQTALGSGPTLQQPSS